MKTFIKYLPLFLIWITLGLISAYKVLIVEKRIYEKYNGMTGTIVWSTFAPRSGIYLCGIRLEDGTYEEVNYGSTPPQSRFVNHIQYGYFMGIVGTAYSVEPDNAPGIGWKMVYLYTVVAPTLIFLVFLLIYKPISWWVKNH